MEARRRKEERLLVYSLSMLAIMLILFGVRRSDLGQSSPVGISSSCGTMAQSTGKAEKVATETAVLISGLCNRFVYRDQPGPFFSTSSVPFSVYIVLHCGQEKVRSFQGSVDTPPYMQAPNVSDIKEWFLHEKGAETVEIKMLEDTAMDEAVNLIRDQATKVHHTVRDKNGYNLTEMLLSNPLFGRWEVEFRKLYARHLVYQMAYSHGHRDFLYVREDNHFLHPLPMDILKETLRRDETDTMLSSSIERNENVPVVILDEPCQFASYSDKLYVTNSLGADLVFGSSLAQFLEMMKRYVLYGYYLKEFDTFQPFQPEAFVHDSLSAATVVQYNMERVDVRYNDGKRCIPSLYYECMPQTTKNLATQHGLVVCDR